MPENHEIQEKVDDHMRDDTFEDLFEHAPCGYVMTRPDGTFVRVNQTLLDWIGYSRDELLSGMSLLDLFPAPGKIFHETHYAPLLRMQGFVNEIAFELVCRDGHRLPIVLNTVQHTDASGTALLNRTTIFNSSQRRQYEREILLARKKAEQALRLRDQFLSLASHELKTPLTAILGNIQLLQRRIANATSVSDRDRRTVDIINSQTQRLNQMVLTLLDTSRIESGQLSILRASVDLHALINRIIDETRATLEGRKIHVEYVSEMVVIQGDELRLEQALQNLFQNAFKYSAVDRPVYVQIRKLATYVEVAITDQGIGIPQTAIPHLFDRYYRATNVEHGGVSGMGIGLYVVKEIIELHGGSVRVESREGQGSTFTVRLPM